MLQEGRHKALTTTDRTGSLPDDVGGNLADRIERSLSSTASTTCEVWARSVIRTKAVIDSPSASRETIAA
ncbi:hypothetical protein FNH09_01795 [Streptomyces adustus]|uniref:Uncharacterized protein n=1 Tax=Streptomyces adustus TaxID=1609272 RepID=A0A5N8V4L3_9ACTN|nr:hypothetical protein [Streptomyces adustus]MPY30097.1 hypothetical protein [Streptomyces adustus]